MHILNMLSMLCWGVVCVCYHLCPCNHMVGHIQSAIVDHGGLLLLLWLLFFLLQLTFDIYN